MDQVLHILKSLIEPVSIIILFIIARTINNWIFSRVSSLPQSGHYVKKSISWLIIFIGSMSFILALPMSNELKGQILSFLAIIISAGVALSSTTILGNLIAGVMNNSMNRFKIGDLIKIEHTQGRVTKKNIFHTEIQLEDSNFITIPNLYIATNPVKLIRKSNTVLSSEVSLGYDVQRSKIEQALKAAALETGLTAPYVYVTSLGDFSVVYKVHGFLENSDKYFSTSSLLNANVMDCLHEAGIEIVSPTFMNQRRADDTVFIPKQNYEVPLPTEEISPEDLIFDEAIKSVEIDQMREQILKLEQRKKTLEEKMADIKDDADKEKIKLSIKRVDDYRQTILEKIEAEKQS